MADRTAAESGWLHRFTPARLSTRLTVSIVVTTAAVFVITSAIVGLSVAAYVRSLASTESVNQLIEARYLLELQARELDALLVGFTEWSEFFAQTQSPDPEFIGDEFDPWLKERASALTVVWAAADGTIVSASGEAADVDALLEFARQNPGGASGTTSLPTGPAVIVVRPIIGDLAADSVGTLSVSRSVSTTGFNPSSLSGAVTVLAEVPEEVEPGWHEVAPPAGYDSAFTRVRNGEFVTRATMLGVNGMASLTLELRRPDPWLGEDRALLVVLVPLGLGLAALGVGYLLSTTLGRSIGRPLHHFVTYLQDQGYLALQGLRTDEQLLVDPMLPDDFAKLGRVITDLMTQLRINQSELIEAGDQALAAERAFRTVVEESPEVKILVREGVVEIANPAAAHFFGLQLGDLLRAEPEGLFSGVKLFDEGGELLDLLNIAREAHDTPVVAQCVAPDQPDRWIELSVAFIDPMGNDYVISARNITEERRLEALRQEVLSLVSHDLRSPLTVVRGYLDILDRPIDDERRAKAVDSARRASERMEELLDDLLHATRAERVFAPKVMRPVDVGVLVEGVATSLQMSTEQTVSTSFEPGVTVLGDPVRLEQAVTNLVGNAIKHGPPEGQIRVGVAARDGRAIISVEDDGPGIPEDQRETVFERGARGSASHGTPGMGLGLYIVRVVAEAHGGLTFVDDTESGTRFVLDLPIVEPDTEAL